MTTESTIDINTQLHALDDPVRASLRGEHRRFASWVGRIGRYDPEVARFVGHPPVPDEQDWADLATLLRPGGSTALHGDGHVPPDEWTVLDEFGSVQMDGTELRVAHDPELEVLTVADVPEILEPVIDQRPRFVGPSPGS